MLKIRELVWSDEYSLGLFWNDVHSKYTNAEISLITPKLFLLIWWISPDNCLKIVDTLCEELYA